MPDSTTTPASPHVADRNGSNAGENRPPADDQSPGPFVVWTTMNVVGAGLLVLLVLGLTLFLALWNAVPTTDTQVLDLGQSSTTTTTTVSPSSTTSEVDASTTITTSASTTTTTATPGTTLTEQPTAAPGEVSWLWWRWSAPSLDLLLMLLVVSAGALGALANAMRWFKKWSTKGYSPSRSRGWDPRYTWWYFLQPPIGAAFAFGVYLILRGGLVSFSTETSEINLYGVTGLAFLVGFTSHRMAEWLNSVARALFPPQQDQAGSNGADRTQAGDHGSTNGTGPSPSPADPAAPQPDRQAPTRDGDP